jgi:multidrug efflux system outer membrane protein
MATRRSLYLLILPLVFTACTVGPDYVRPPQEMPGRWSVPYQDAADLTNSAWWSGFGDPVLDELVQTAVRENLDLRIAVARVDQYLGRLDTTRAEFFPRFDAGLNVGTQDGEGTSGDFAKAALNAGWEVDLWGRIRRANEAATAQLLASEEGRRAVLLSLVSNVAGSYVTLRGFDRQLAIARMTEQAYTETLRIFKLRYQYGTISQLQLSQAESLYESARTAVPSLEAQIKQQENLLSLLTGRLPGSIPRGREIGQFATPAIPADLPSTLLERRPDIIQAEQTLIAANAQIGVARAAYFPSITLTGMLGSASGDLGDLLSSGSGQSSLAGSIAGPLLDFGTIAGQVKQSEALQQQALFQYRQTVLNACREVEDALIKTSKGREEAESQRKQVEALTTTARLSRLQYEGGSVDYLQVLDAERSLFSGQLSLVEREVNVLTSLISVYKAMGGGWITRADELAATPAVEQRP